MSAKTVLTLSAACAGVFAVTAGVSCYVGIRLGARLTVREARKHIAQQAMDDHQVNEPAVSQA